MNNDYSNKVSIDTDTLLWENTNLKISTHINSVEIFVLECTYINEFGKFSQGSYLHLPKEKRKLENKYK